MTHGIKIALVLCIAVAACATPPAKTIAEPPPAPTPAAEVPVAPAEAPAAPAALSTALRAQLGASGAQVSESADGSLRLTLPGAIAFASGSRSVSPAAQPILDRIAAALKAHPGWRVLIEGHTDSVGRELFNEELSLHRAESVLNYLAEHGLDANKLEAAGRGEHAPVADNATAKGRAANRRTEIIITPARD